MYKNYLPVLLVSAFLLCSGTNCLAESPADAATTTADTSEQLRFQLERAKAGDFGKLRAGEYSELETRTQRLIELLDERGPEDLKDAEATEYREHQEYIATLLQVGKPDRIVCRPVQKLGTRIASTECLTVAQRLRRAGASRDLTDQLQKVHCVPSSDNACGG